MQINDYLKYPEHTLEHIPLQLNKNNYSIHEGHCQNEKLSKKPKAVPLILPLPKKIL